MFCGVEYFALLRLALLADGLVLRNAVLVEVPATDLALGHIIRRWSRGGLLQKETPHIHNWELYNVKRGRAFKERPQET